MPSDDGDDYRDDDEDVDDRIDINDLYDGYDYLICRKLQWNVRLTLHPGPELILFSSHFMLRN